MKLTIGSLFSGIGAFDLGFEQAGYSTAWMVEKDENCRTLLADKFPKAKLFDDVLTVGAHNLSPVDVLCGGWPCQDLSVAGKRGGIKASRSGLFFELLRIVYELKPAFVLTENVPGLLSSCSCKSCGRRCVGCGSPCGPEEECLACGGDDIRGRVLPAHRGADFFAVLSAFGSIGYHGAWRFCDCQYWGLAQRRKRWFGLFSFGNTGAERLGEILLIRESLRGDTAPSREEGQRIAPTIEGRAGRSGANNFATSGGHAQALRSEGADASEDGTGRGTPLVTVPDCARNERAQSQSSHREDSETYVAVAAQRGSHHRRDDLDNDTYVVNQPVNEVSPALKARDCKGQSSDGFGDGAPLIPVSVTPIQSINMVREKKQNGIGIGQPGDEMFTLTGRDQHAVAFAQNQRQEVRTVEVAGAISAIRRGDAKNETLLSFSSKDSGNDATNDLAPTLRSQNFKDSHMNGGGQVAVCATITKNYATHHGRTAGNNGGIAEGQLQPVGHMVRRLTPTECERLMGFSDGWTSGFSDSVRYRMLGNSLAVPVARWIAERMKKALT